jgi:hypothetical protein
VVKFFYRDRVASPVLQPPTWGVPILVAFYDMHGLQWDYSLPWSPHGDMLVHTIYKITKANQGERYFQTVKNTNASVLMMKQFPQIS